jgi:hypothetical protein
VSGVAFPRSSGAASGDARLERERQSHRQEVAARYTLGGDGRSPPKPASVGALPQLRRSAIATLACPSTTPACIPLELFDQEVASPHLPGVRRSVSPSELDHIGQRAVLSAEVETRRADT